MAITHRESKTRLHRIWCAMKTRCTNRSQKSWSRYGGRGISVCDAWSNSYEAFRDWAVSSGYSDDLTIDRIDNDGDYGPSNCRWSNYSEQAMNRSSSVLVCLRGESKNLFAWMRQFGIEKGTMNRRVRRGWSAEEALVTPSKRGGTNIDEQSKYSDLWRVEPIRLAGECDILSGWLRRLGMLRQVYGQRLSRGWTSQEALTTPTRTSDREAQSQYSEYWRDA